MTEHESGELAQRQFCEHRQLVYSTFGYRRKRRKRSMQSRLAGQAARVFGLRRRISGVSLSHLIGGEIPGQQRFYLLNCGDIG